MTEQLFKVTYERVGRRGGRNDSPPPPPFNVLATDADSLAAHVHKDARRYLVSPHFEVVVDLDAMRGFICAGFSNAGSFTVERTPVAEGGESA